MKLVQCLIKSGDTTKTIFLESGVFNKGFYVTLKDSEDPTRRWKIEEMYEEVDEKDVKDSHGSSKVYDSIQKEFEK